MEKIWNKSGAARMTRSGPEAAFSVQRAPGTPNGFSLTFAPFTNELNRMRLTIPGGTFALFHVHPNGNWEPSTPANNYDGNDRGGDVSTANRANIDIYVVSSGGLG